MIVKDTRTKKQRKADANAVATTKKMADQFITQSAQEKIRFVVAEEISDADPDACWADLATWAMGYTPWEDINFTGSCQRPPDFDEESGGCYCGKHMIEDLTADELDPSK